MLRPRSLLLGLATLAVVSAARAQTDLDFRLVAVTAPTASQTVTTLPASITSVCFGDTYYIELWASDVGTVNTGVSSAYVDLVWTGGLATALSVDHGFIYDTLPSGTIGFGQVDELGGSTLSSPGVGIEPEWARVAVVELMAGPTGDIAFTLVPSATGVAALGRGVIPWVEVNLGPVTLTTQWCADALLSCTPVFQDGAPGGTVALEIFVEGVMGLNAYQVEVDPVRTFGPGSLMLVDAFVDDAHLDFVFEGLDHVDISDPANMRIAGVATQSATVDVPGGWQPAYLGTFVFSVSGDVTNASMFEVRILPEPSSLLLDPFSQTLPLSTAPACAVGTLDCEPPTVIGEGGRYLQVTLNPPSSLIPQAIRVTAPDCPELLKYVDEYGCPVSDTPTFKTPMDWGVIHLTSDTIVPDFTYEVTPLCGAAHIEGGRTSASTWSWGDVNDEAGVNVVDIQKVVQCAEGTFHGGTTIYNTDLISDCDDGPECEVYDVLAVLDAFRSLPYPSSIPCGSRAQPPPVSDGPPEASEITGAAVTLVPAAPSAPSGSLLTVEAFVQNVTDLRAYQIQLSVTGGILGRLLCDQLFVDTSRTDYVFYDASSGDWPWVNTDHCRVSSALTEGGMEIGPEPKYLGTFVLASTNGTCGTFGTAQDPVDSVLLDHDAQPIPFVASSIGLTVWSLGDYDCDGDVDLADFNNAFVCFTGPGSDPLDAGCQPGDADSDDDVDLADFAWFQVAFTGHPEPRPTITHIYQDNGAVRDGSGNVNPDGPASIEARTKGITVCTIQFSEEVSIQASDIQVRDLQDTMDETWPSIFDHDPATHTLTMAWPPGTFEDQWVRIHVLDSVTSVATGAALDGEVYATSGDSGSGLALDGQLPSGDGASGGAAMFVLGALTGDVDGNRVVNSFDRLIVKQNQGSTEDIPSDVDGNGVINSFDRLIVKQRQGNSLPPLPQAGNGQILRGRQR